MEYITERELMPYKLGALLYTPATNTKIAEKVNNREIHSLKAFVLCLEDSIADEDLQYAEQCMVKTLKEIKNKTIMVFVRVRNPEHLKHIYQLLEENGIEEKVAGYVLPKFNKDNCFWYLDTVKNMPRYLTKHGYKENESYNPVYIMPVFETEDIANISIRHEVLSYLYDSLCGLGDTVLNIRVGGNDFCNLYGIRRTSNQTIYDAAVIQDIFKDIVNIFGQEYVISGPVWEYFGNNQHDQWAVGLKRECKMDMLNGFFGKTAIHPSQVPVINSILMPLQSDVADAKRILENQSGGAGNSNRKGSMIEPKTHTKWAKQIVARSIVFGEKYA